MRNLPWFPFYLNDWETDTKVRLMGPVARSFFLVLLMHQWREDSIPADRKLLRLLLLMPSDPTIAREDAGSRLEDFVDYDAVLDQVLQCFAPTDKGGLVNGRMETIRAGRDQKRDKSAIGGQRGGRARSEAKTKAVRANGAKGGRPTQGSLGFDSPQAPENTEEKNQKYARARQSQSQSQSQIPKSKSKPSPLPPKNSPDQNQGKEVEPVTSQTQKSAEPTNGLPQKVDAPNTGRGVRLIVSAPAPTKTVSGIPYDDDRVPANLQPFEYARRFLTAVGLPEKEHLDVTTGAIKSFAKFRGSSHFEAFKEMKARGLADMERGVEVDHLWIMNGRYRVDPTKPRPTARDREMEEFRRKRAARASAAGD
jgi:uncharacterized protein YdaU (DUF1376 family)